MKSIIFIFVLIVAFCSCEKTKNINPQPASSNCLVSFILDAVSGDTINGYQYDAQGRLTRLSYYDTTHEKIFYYTSYIYNPGSIIITQTSSGSPTDTTSYYLLNTNGSIATEVIKWNNYGSDTLFYQYNPSGYLSSVIQVSVSGTSVMRDTISYQYTNGNLTKAIFSGNTMEVDYSYNTSYINTAGLYNFSYSYDYPSVHFSGPDLYGKTCTNLPTTITSTSSSFTGGNFVQAINYVFNSSGQPSQITGQAITNPSGNTSLNYSYKCLYQCK